PQRDSIGHTGVHYPTRLQPQLLVATLQWAISIRVHSVNQSTGPHPSCFPFIPDRLDYSAKRHALERTNDHYRPVGIRLAHLLLSRHLPSAVEMAGEILP